MTTTTTRYYFEDKLEEILSSIVVRNIINSYYNQIRMKYKEKDLEMLKTKENFYKMYFEECKESYALLSKAYTEEEIFQMLTVNNICETIEVLLDSIYEEIEWYYRMEDRKFYQNSNRLLN